MARNCVEELASDLELPEGAITAVRTSSSRRGCGGPRLPGQHDRLAARADPVDLQRPVDGDRHAQRHRRVARVPQGGHRGRGDAVQVQRNRGNVLA